MDRERLYKEVADSLERIKNREIDEKLTSPSINLDNVLESIEESIETYEMGLHIFSSWIFEGVFPDDIDDKLNREKDADSSEEEDVQISSIFSDPFNGLVDEYLDPNAGLPHSDYDN